jgi:hypothetical protein
MVYGVYRPFQQYISYIVAVSFIGGENWSTGENHRNTMWVCARLCKLQKGSIRLAAASDKVYQLLAHDRWFSPGTPASSTTKT